MKTLVLWIKSFLFIILFSQQAQSFPNFIKDSNGFLNQLTEVFKSKIIDYKKNFHYYIENDSFNFDVAQEHSFCLKGLSTIKASQSQSGNTFTDTLSIKECGVFKGTIVITRIDPEQKKIPLKDLLHFKLPEITSETSYTINFLNNLVGYYYTKKPGQTNLALNLGNSGVGFRFEYFESINKATTLRTYKSTNNSILRLKKIKRKGFYELNIHNSNSNRLSYNDFYNAYQLLEENITSTTQTLLFNLFSEAPNSAGGFSLSPPEQSK